jgi:hypothetical protein
MEQIVDRILRFNDTLAEIDISITSLPGILLSKQLTETPGNVILSIKYAKPEFFEQPIPDNVNFCKSIINSKYSVYDLFHKKLIYLIRLYKTRQSNLIEMIALHIGSKI